MLKFIALVVLLLEMEEGFYWALEFLETSALMLYAVPIIWLMILGMFIIPILQLSAGLFLLTCKPSLASRETYFLSWSLILN